MDRRRMFFSASGALAMLSIVTLVYYWASCMGLADSEHYLKAPRRMVNAKILSHGYQYTGNCITQQNLAMLNFTSCSQDILVMLQCKDMQTKEYPYPDIPHQEDIEKRRLRASSHHSAGRFFRHGSNSFHCSDRYVPWMKVQIHGSDLIRCAYRFGTLLNSEERTLEEARKRIEGRHALDKFWVQSSDQNSCVVGFGDLKLLKDPLAVEMYRAEIWTLWILLGFSSLVVLGCAIYVPEETSGENIRRGSFARTGVE